jgi:hypothetical protein
MPTSTEAPAPGATVTAAPLVPCRAAGAPTWAPLSPAA